MTQGDLLPEIFRRQVEKRRAIGTLRCLSPSMDGIDFCSNDYLGFARDKQLQQCVLRSIELQSDVILGATGSRLLSGNSFEVLQLEEQIAEVHQVQTALFFASGYLANLSLFSALALRTVTLIVDEWVHSSVHDGIQMGFAKKIKFKHNDLLDLEKHLQNCTSPVLVAVESLYSMDGSFSPLLKLVELCELYQAKLIVDEAHAFGVFELGLVEKLQLQKRVWATVVTYGKALGVQGASVLCDGELKEYLVNFAKPFVYSTAPIGLQLAAVAQAYRYLKISEQPALLQQKIGRYLGFEKPGEKPLLSPIQTVKITGNDAVNRAARDLQIQGFKIFPIRSPTVAVGEERLRICLHSFNSHAEIDALLAALQAQITTE